MSAQINTIDAVPGDSHYKRGHAASTLLLIVAAVYSLFGHLFLSESLQSAIAGLTGMLLILAACLPIVRDGMVYFDIRSAALALWMCMLSVSYIFSDTIETSPGTYLPTIIRSMIAVSALTYFMRYDGEISLRVRLAILSLVVVVAVVPTMLYGSYDYAGTPRPQSFAGEDAIHTSAYIVCAAFLTIVLMRIRREVGLLTALLLGIPLLALLLAYQVRTAWVMTIVFFIVLTLKALRLGTTRRLFSATLGVGLATSILAIMALVFLFLPNFDLTEFSSGRTSTYSERVSMLVDRPAGQLLFGSGLGSDASFSSVWWWEKKDSHNDILNVTIEQGLLGLLMLLVVLAVSLRQANILQVAVLLSFISGSFISNGLLARPMPAVLFLAMMLPSFRGQRAGVGTRRLEY